MFYRLWKSDSSVLAFHPLQVLNSNYDWPIWISAFVVIGLVNTPLVLVLTNDIHAGTVEYF